MAGQGNFEKTIETYGKLVYPNVGDSMWPMLREGRDLVIIEACEGRLRRYDVPLYRRDSGQYVLHRILRVRKEDYVICGDNRRHREYGITDRHVVGRLTAVVRDGREIPVTDIRYRIYVHLWCDLFLVRAGILFVLQLPAALRRRLHRKRK